MSEIRILSGNIDFPVYNSNARSIKNTFLNVATGGRLNSDSQGRVVIKALEDINLHFSDGDRVGLVGHNGAGKSTLLRLLSGVYEPTSGSIQVEGQVGSLIDMSLGIDPEATGRENIYIRGSLLGMTKAQITERIDSIVSFSELGNFIDMPLRTYSSGMQMRLAFAVSTTVFPEILLMDEWLSVGDEHFKHKAEERLKSLVMGTKILVIASHSQELIRNTCNRVLWLEHGRVVMDGPAEIVSKAYFES